MDNNKISGADINELIRRVNLEGNNGNGAAQEVNKFIEENLSSGQASALKEILNNEEKTKAILNSEAAKSLFKKFFGGGSNG